MSNANKTGEPEAPQDVHQVSKDIDWQDYRDHLSTADKQGHRKWVYAKKPAGLWYNRRNVFAWVLIIIMFVGPWVRINGNPLLMFNILGRKFAILGQMFWPEDSIIFAVAMLLFLTSIVLFTTVFGRLWCGWACPQTVMMEMVFRKLDYLIEGDAHQQRALDAAPWTGSKIAKKTLKHVIYLGLSFAIGNTLLAYIIGSDALLAIQADNPANHVSGLVAMVLFTLLFYSIFARFREQACTFICPYGRFQSAMIDENTMVVAYDNKRGEKRAPLHRGQSIEQRQAEGAGDCISCKQCVVVCPTGIDIRDGLQMECVNCTACIDACDSVMDKIKRPRGLIRYASLNSIEKGTPLRFTGRMGIYSVILTALVVLLSVLVFTRSDVETLLLRAPGSLYQQLPDGRLQNLYTLKILNKTSHDIPVTLKLENVAGELSVVGGKLLVPKDDLTKTSVLIKIPAGEMHGQTKKLVVGIYSGDKRIETVKTAFVGPRDHESHEKSHEESHND